MTNQLISNKKRLQQQFSSYLSEFTNKIEAIKQKQGEILTNLEKAQIEENSELDKINSEIKPSSEITAVFQNAVNLSSKQIETRDQAIQLQKEELKTSQETIAELITTSQEQLNNINSEINQQIEKLNAWRVLQEEHSDQEKAEWEQKLASFKKWAWIIGAVAVVLAVVITFAICYFVFKK